MHSRLSAAVVVPIYKTVINNVEFISLTQLFRVLSQYDIFIVYPEGLDLNNYSQFHGNFKSFPAEYFADVHGYSRLLRSALFYEFFLDYDYILVSQADSFVFRDELDHWCNRDFDYIGAPWIFELSAFSAPYLPFLHRDSAKWRVRLRKLFGDDFLVGNGGFSLRKIQSFLNVLKNNRSEILQYEKHVNGLLSQGIETADNEDSFWALFIPTIRKDFKIPKYQEALKFAFEVNPKYCFEKNNYVLPFGCHAWEKHALEFWRPYINKCGYDLIV